MSDHPKTDSAEAVDSVEPDGSTTSPARRVTAMAALLLALGAGLLWTASRVTWVRAVSADGLGEEQT
ncbi:MAG: hypothetical protein GX542_07345, partial [Rhodococcus sp.]|nr:hypothetical protein [Rhodococcus sp. (in: high G+C Gram-positive bacteria)]